MKNDFEWDNLKKLSFKVSLLAIALDFHGKYDSYHQEETCDSFLIYILPSVVHAQMVDEANTKLMRDYVLETSHIEDDDKR
jgi:hypothetical protein